MDDQALDSSASVGERSLQMVTALTAEVVVLRQRLAILEMLIERNGGLAAGAVDGFTPDAATAAAFRTDRQGLIARVFRALHS